MGCYRIWENSYSGMISQNNFSQGWTTKNNSNFYISKYDGVLKTEIHKYTGLNYDEKKDNKDYIGSAPITEAAPLGKCNSEG